MFEEPFYPVTVFENIQAGTVLVTVVATDEDSGSNGQVVYSTSVDNPLVEVDNVTGEVYLISAPDYEELQVLLVLVRRFPILVIEWLEYDTTITHNKHTIQVTASDLGVPPRETNVPVSIIITPSVLTLESDVFRLFKQAYVPSHVGHYHHR